MQYLLVGLSLVMFYCFVAFSARSRNISGFSTDRHCGTVGALMNSVYLQAVLKDGGQRTVALALLALDGVM